MLDPKNMGVAVEISSTSCLGAEKHAIKVHRSPSWIFPLPVWSHSLLMSPNGKLDPKNIGTAVEILLKSCLEAEIHAIKVYRPPYWIFQLPVWSHSLLICPKCLICLIWKARSRKHRHSRWNFVDILSGSGDTCIWSFEAAILDFSTSGSVAQYSHKSQWNAGLKNVGLAVGISVLSCWLPCLKAEIHAIEVFRPPSRIYPLPVKSHSIPIYSNGKLDPKCR